MHKNFCALYNSGEVDVSFCLNRYPIRNQHAALRGFGGKISKASIFPTPENFDCSDKRRFRWLRPFPLAIKMITGLNKFQSGFERAYNERADFHFNEKYSLNPSLSQWPCEMC